MKIAVTMADFEHWSGSEVRLSVNGRASSPVEWDHGIIDRGVTEVFLVAFEVPKDATEAELRVPWSARVDHLEYADPIVLSFAETSLADLPQP